MAAPREGSSPLRPYYIPPSIGLSPESASNNASAAASRESASSSAGFSFPDLDYSAYLSDASPPVAASFKSLLDKALLKYATVLLAQPFEVAKLILQVHVAQDGDDRLISESDSRSNGLSAQRYGDGDYADSSDDEPNLFTSSTPIPPPSSRSPRRGRQGRPTNQHSNRTSQGPPDVPSHRLQLKNPYSLFDALSSLSSNSGALSLWRATNTTFLYSLLSRTLETFLRSFLAAVFGIADTDILIPAPPGAIPSSAILASSVPGASVLIAAVASTISSLLLAPIDASRTRLILTPSSQSPRSLLATLRTFSPSYMIPSHLVPITLLTSGLPALISTSSPLFLKNYLKIDPILNPSCWSIATFLVSAVDLSVKFPLETVLRRAQIVTWTAPSRSPPTSKSARKAIETIVPVPQVYRGILPTMYGIVREEGTSICAKDRAAMAMGKSTKKRKGQGVEGLYRGWRLGVWSLVGVWGAGYIGSLQAPGEAAMEGVAAHAGKF